MPMIRTDINLPRVGRQLEPASTGGHQQPSSQTETPVPTQPIEAEQHPIQLEDQLLSSLKIEEPDDNKITQPASEDPTHPKVPPYSSSSYTGKEPIVDIPFKTVLIPAVGDFPSGHPRLAAYKASEDDFQIYRRFTYLHTRLLESKQVELSKLEHDLAKLDYKEAVERLGKYPVGVPPARPLEKLAEELFSDERSERVKLLDRINACLKEYDDLLLRTQALLAIPNPRPGALDSLRTLALKTRIDRSEVVYTKHKLDLMSLVAPSSGYAWVDECFEQLVKLLSRLPYSKRLYCTEEYIQRGNDPWVSYYTKSRAALTIGCLGIMLIVLGWTVAASRFWLNW